jgi:hypothetical protein
LHPPTGKSEFPPLVASILQKNFLVSGIFFAGGGGGKWEGAQFFYFTPPNQKPLGTALKTIAVINMGNYWQSCVAGII